MATAPSLIRYRAFTVTAPVPPDRIFLQELSGTELVNELGMFRLRVVYTGDPLTESQIGAFIGRQITVTAAFDESEERKIIQTCFGTRSLGRNDHGSIYELELRPWIWVMSRRQNSKIFHNKTVDEIIADVLSEYHGMQGAQFENRCGSGHPTLEYTVQYQETDLNFIRRLMEEFGLNFHIEMRDDAQFLVLTNGPDDFARPVDRHRSFQLTGSSELLDENFATWIAQRQLTTGAVRMTDYNFLAPTQSMVATASRESVTSLSNLESYEHPGRYTQQSEGHELARRRIHALRGADAQIKASGYAPSLGAGMRFTLNDGGDNPGLEAEYAVIGASHHYFEPGFDTSGSASPGYHGEYTFVRSHLPIAPDRVTPRPYLRGPQSAKVVQGADGDVDEHGRIKVVFPWGGDVQSMYCRVSQLWAGDRWGAQFIPRAGMEVLVDFIEGDPDRPVIVGCLYNQDNRYPGALPDKKTTSGIKTDSIGGEGHNALIFEDKSGSEEVFIHAQKDLMIKVLDRELVEIDGDSKRKIAGKSETVVEGEKTTTVTGAVTMESYESIELKVGASSIKIEASKITISSPAIKIEAMGQLEATGTLTKLSATAQMTVQAAIVMIN